VNIRFTSSLTPEHESAIAPALLAALSSILELLPIAYILRIDTSDSQVFELSSHDAARASGSSESITARPALPVAAESR
jgi:hypothetical protein